MTEDQLVRQVMQGGGNMPAYGKNLSSPKQLPWLHSSIRCIRRSTGGQRKLQPRRTREDSRYTMHHHGSWSINVTLVFAVAAVFYARAWQTTARDIRRLVAFLAGMLTLWIVLASPLAQMDHQQLTAHMVQHLVIMTVAAPLLLSGLRSVTRLAIDVHPAVCWLAGTGIVVWWHIPAFFDLGMSSAASGVESSRQPSL